MGVNLAIIQGRFTKAPVLQSGSGKNGTYSYCFGQIANEQWVDKRKLVNYINYKAYRGTADFICKWFQPDVDEDGKTRQKEITMEGSITTYVKEKDGYKFLNTLLDVRAVHFAGRPVYPGDEEIIISKGAPDKPGGDRDDEGLPF